MVIMVRGGFADVTVYCDENEKYGENTIGRWFLHDR
jgi:hypothetical protein